MGYDKIQETITNNIYHDLLPITNSLEDITVIDYFPQYIVDNFEMKYVDGIDVSNISATIDKTTNSITWNLESLPAGQTATIQYTLTLNEKFDETILNKILDTNTKVDITYKDFDGESQSKTSDVTPKIKLTQPIDDTIAEVPLPQTGSKVMILSFIVLIVLAIFFKLKYNKLND